MDARLLRLAAFVPALLLLAASSSQAANYSYATPNFVVSAPSPEFAKQVGETAERYRSVLAREWVRSEVPRPERPLHGENSAGGEGFSPEQWGWRRRGKNFTRECSTTGEPKRFSGPPFPAAASLGGRRSR